MPNNLTKLYLPFALSCQAEIKQYCKRYLDNNWDYKTEKIFRLNPFDKDLESLHIEIDKRNLPSVESLSLFSRGSNNKQAPHIDTITDINGNLIKSYSNIYVPIINVDGILIWYDNKHCTEKIISVQSYINYPVNYTIKTLLVFFTKYPKILGAYNGNDTVIVNTLLPHSGISNSYPRSALSIRLKGNPDLINLLST